MRVCLVLLIVSMANVCFAENLGSIVRQINQNNVSLNTLNTLMMLEESHQGVGFGLCVMAGNEPRACDKNGSVGYGMCTAAGNAPAYCDKKGSIGYGVCVTAGIEPRYCDKNGSIGYGMCISSGNEPRSCL